MTDQQWPVLIPVLECRLKIHGSEQPNDIRHVRFYSPFSPGFTVVFSVFCTLSIACLLLFISEQGHNSWQNSLTEVYVRKLMLLALFFLLNPTQLPSQLSRA